MKSIEYLNKEAEIGGMSALGISNVANRAMGLLPYLVTIPLVAGAGTGYAASKLSSPSAADVDTLQREALLTKVKSETGLRERAMLARQQLQQLDQDLQARNKNKQDRFLIS